MKKFIRYLYEYQNGRRVRSAGFVKVEESGRGTVLQIYGKGFPVTGQSVEILLFYLVGDQVVGIPVGEAQNGRQMFGYCLEYTPEDVGGAEPYEAVGGVALRVCAPRCQWFAAAWGDPSVNVEQMVLREELLRGEEQESEEQESQEQPGELRSNIVGKEKTEKEKAEKEKAEEENAEKENAEKEKVEKESAEKEKAEKEKAEKESAVKEKAEKERAEKEEAEKESAEKRSTEEETEKKVSEKENTEKRGTEEEAEKEDETKTETETSVVGMPKKHETEKDKVSCGMNSRQELSSEEKCKAGALQEDFRRESHAVQGEVPLEFSKENCTQEQISLRNVSARQSDNPEMTGEERGDTSDPQRQVSWWESSLARGDISSEDLEGDCGPASMREEVREEPVEEPAGKREADRLYKIRRQDLARLPRREWKLANNHFLLHGYRNYHHLILFQANGSHWLGVPGIYHPVEQRAAEAFGFGQFLEAGEVGITLDPEEAAGQSRFGYWCRAVSGGFPD